jgi:ferredoxin-NADP reductase
LPKDPAVPLVFIVGGIGIVPVRSMIAWLKAHNEQRNIELLYSASTSDELIFDDLFRSYPMRYTPSITKGSSTGVGQTGRLTSSRVKEWIGDDITNKLIYLSGPQGLIEPLFNELITNEGIPRAQLVLDYFPGY